MLYGFVSEQGDASLAKPLRAAEALLVVHTVNRSQELPVASFARDSSARTMLSAFKGHEAELKSQGVVQAAQDPESNVTAADASRVILFEAQQAQGAGAAFQCVPDATPAEKAAQARSVRLAGLQAHYNLLTRFL